MIATAEQLDRFDWNVAERWTDVSDVLQALGGRRFVRAPLRWSRSLESALWNSLRERTPLRIVILWGKGRKDWPDSYESRTARFLAKYAKRVEAVWPAGIRYHVLFADTHAALNGYTATESSRYFAAVRTVLGEQNTFGSLSCLWQKGELSWQAMEQKAGEIKGDEWNEVNEQLNLVAAASRHSVSGKPERLARLYYVVRRAENRILANAFSGYLFATTEGPERSLVLPDLPVLHMFSWQRGRCAKPWNMADETPAPIETACELESCAA